MIDRFNHSGVNERIPRSGAVEKIDCVESIHLRRRRTFLLTPWSGFLLPPELDQTGVGQY